MLAAPANAGALGQLGFHDRRRVGENTVTEGNILSAFADPVDDPGQQLDFDTGVGVSSSRLERQAAEVREWAQTTTTGDRDEIEDVDGRVWRAFSVTSRECVGAAKCQFGADCFA